MKTTDFAIDKVYQVIRASALTQPVYPLTKPSTKSDTEYIVINALPIGEGVLQKCIVNVNLHVKDLSSGMADLKKLTTVTASLMTLLENIAERGIIVNFESQEYFKEEELGYHYSNIRLKVKIVNN